VILNFCAAPPGKIVNWCNVKFVLVIATGDEAVDRNHTIVTEGPHRGGGGIHHCLVTRSAANNYRLDASLLQHRLQLTTIKLVEGGRENDRLVIAFA
jgi:hypothetical protein